MNLRSVLLTIISLAVLTLGATPLAGSEPPAKKDRVRLTGTLQLDLVNRNEVYPDQDRALPNNFSQSKLALHYALDEKNQLLLEEQAIRRRRNELVRENFLTFQLTHLHSAATVFTLRDVLSSSRYPENPIKDFRNNLVEAQLSRKERRWERSYTAAFEKRSYPRFGRSDFTQGRFTHESTRFIPDGTLFGSVALTNRSHGASPYLDYRESDLTLSFNRSYPGNRSELSVGETFNTQHFRNEEINLFRTTYWDNLFSFRYELPVSKAYSLIFEDEWQKRKYPSDELRGYGRTSLKTTVSYAPTRKTRGRISHQFIHNDEESRVQAHKNHLFSGSWERRFSDRWKLRLEDKYHQRFSVVDDLMDFRENTIAGNLTWMTPSSIELCWKSDFLNRTYTNLHYPDFTIARTGVVATFVKPGKYDWQLEQFYRSFSHRNGRNIPTDWITADQPIFQVRLNFILEENLRLRLQARREKTFYRTFDPVSLDMLWDFTRPVNLSEFSGSLEYTF